MVRLLLRKGADPNAADLSGRFPLMEAALWGRLENVQLLLEYKANKSLECIRNGQRTLAVDFARPLKANAQERYSRSGGTYQIYKENTYERDRDRRAIVRTLENIPEIPVCHDHDLKGVAFAKSPKAENLLTLIAHFDVPHRWKTIAVLSRGGQFPCIAAMSGWAHVQDHNINIQVSGRDWTPEVHRLCEAIEHDLKPHDYDQGEPGKYHACHAEK